MPATVKLYDEDVIPMLERAMSVKGADYRYQSPPRMGSENVPKAVYFDAWGKPSCLIGHLLAELGAEGGGYQWEHGPVLNLRMHGFIDCSARAAAALRAAQIAQDCRETWGHAVWLAWTIMQDGSS